MEKYKCLVYYLKCILIGDDSNSTCYWRSLDLVNLLLYFSYYVTDFCIKNWIVLWTGVFKFSFLQKYFSMLIVLQYLTIIF